MRYDLYTGDLEPSIASGLGGGQALPDGTTVTFIMAQADGPARVSGLAVIDDPGSATTDPQVHYQWQLGDTDSPGVYRAVWRVVYPGGAGETFPSDETLYVVVHPQL